MQDALFGGPGGLALPDLLARADRLKLDAAAYRSCLESGKYKSQILKAINTASDMQIVATPSFLIGKTNGDLVDGAIITGAQPLSAFEVKRKEFEPRQ